MIHSFTPSGVEHTSSTVGDSASWFVIHSFTPSGVEHYYWYELRAKITGVIHSFTPSNLFDSHRTDFVFAGARDGVSGVVG